MQRYRDFHHFIAQKKKKLYVCSSNCENRLHNMAPKFLIIRFSSIGDIIQCMGVIGGIKKHFPHATIHWVTRQDMAPILAIDGRIDQIWPFDKREGLSGLLHLARRLKKEEYDYIYDAHSNIRSNILKLCLRSYMWGKPSIVVRSKERWKRFLLFRLGINRFPKPFRGRISFQKPLEKWGITYFPELYRFWQFPSDFPKKFDSLIMPKTVTIIPSANWEMKRWPVSCWQQLIRLSPQYHFLILAGPQDTFCENIRNAAPERVTNLAGQTSLLESCYLVFRSHAVVSADTGFLHAADLFQIPALALMGPTAFGYPSGHSVRILESPLPCRPCTKDGHGKCKQPIYQLCMLNLTPEQVAHQLHQLLP